MISETPSQPHFLPNFLLMQHARKKVPRLQNPESPDLPVSNPLSPGGNILTDLYFLPFSFWLGGGQSRTREGTEQGKGIEISGRV